MSSIFGNVIEGLKKLTQALQALRPAPDANTVLIDNTIILEDETVPTYTNTLDNYGVNIEDGSNSLIIQSSSIQLHDNAGANGVYGVNGLVFNDPGGQVMQASTLELQYIDNSNFGGVEVDFGLAADNSVMGFKVKTGYNASENYSATLGMIGSNAQDPTLELRNDTVPKVVTLTGSYFSVDSHEQSFEFRNNQRIVKWNCSTSFRFTNDSHTVYVDDAFKLSDGFDFDFQTYSSYLDINGLPGFSVILSNGSGGDIYVTNPDGIIFYSHGTTQSAAQTLKKYATARFTLVQFQNLDYAWAVSMY